MLVWSFFDVAEAKGVIQETGNSVGRHCVAGGYTTFFVLLVKDGYTKGRLSQRF